MIAGPYPTSRNRRRSLMQFAVAAALGMSLLVPLRGQENGPAETETSDPVSVEAAPTATAPSAESDRPVIIIPITDTITDITYDSFRRRVDRAREDNAGAIVIELDTPGGSLPATLEICKVIKQLRADDVRIVSWVHHDAYSAGTIIALATDEILMSPHATIGDAQPIMFTAAGAEAVDESIEAKVTSPLLAELEDSARLGGYDYDVILSFIRPEMVLYWLENTETSERRLATPEQRSELFGYERYRTVADTTTQPAAGAPDHWLDDAESRTAWKYIEHDDALGDIAQPVLDERELLTMRTPKALAYGFCEARIDDQAELKAYLGATGPVITYGSTALEKIVDWLASPMVRSLLFLLMLMGAYLEFQTPGFGAGGAVAIVGLILFLGAPYLAGYAVAWEIIFIVVGFALVAVEIFVIPGFGIAGIAGFLLIIVGTIASFVPEEPWFPGKEWYTLPSFQGTYEYMITGLYATAFGLVGSLVAMAFLARYMRWLPIGRQLIAANPTPQQVHVDDVYEGVAKVGDIGKTETLLRPAGKARFGAKMVDVVSEGEYIERGNRVEVVQRVGNRVVVRRAS